MKVIQIDGGIGRVLCATPAFEAYYRNTGEKIIVTTSWPEVLFNAPYIHKLYGLNSTPYLWEDVIKGNEFINPEPYHNHFYYNQYHHLIDSFNLLINGTACSNEANRKPTIYLNNEEIKYGKQIIDEASKASKKDYVVALQTFGSGAQVSEAGKPHDASNRSLPVEVVDAILNNPKCVFINLSHIPMNHPNVWQQPNLNIRQIFAIANASSFIVTVDSLLSHIGAAFNKNGILMLGSTFKENVGYDHYITVQKEGFPKSYCPNRFPGFIDNNSGAMDYNKDEVDFIVESINSLCK